MSQSSHETRARSAWGEAVPTWIIDLARECALTSQSRVAIRMNRSAAVINAVLGNKYQGSYEAVEEVFNGTFKGAVVDCPALGSLPANECRDWRAKAGQFASTNAQRVAMYRACNRCPRHGKAGA